MIESIECAEAYLGKCQKVVVDAEAIRTTGDQACSRQQQYGGPHIIMVLCPERKVALRHRYKYVITYKEYYIHYITTLPRVSYQALMGGGYVLSASGQYIFVP